MHTSSQGGVTAKKRVLRIPSTLGDPTESLQGNRVPRSTSMTIDVVSPSRLGSQPKDLATAGPPGPVGLVHRDNTTVHPQFSFPKKYGSALNYKRWTEIDEEEIPSVKVQITDELNPRQAAMRRVLNEGAEWREKFEQLRKARAEELHADKTNSSKHPDDKKDDVHTVSGEAQNANS